jgi:hypothetical protein
MKNQLIIFSKNRACQLHLLLESIVKCSTDLFNNITVLYKSDSGYESGYELLKKRFKWVNFKLEENFRKDTLELINYKCEYTTFLVDDVVFFDKHNSTISDITEYMNTKDVLCFSLRVGTNSTYSHPANVHYKMGEYETNGKFIHFNFREQKGDLSYPLSVDGHIFKTTTIKDLVSNTMFHNPNTLESNLQQYMRGNLPSNIMASFIHSKMVSVPVNLVNDTFKNRHGLKFYISEEELNNRYLGGEVISYYDLDFYEINGPHKELEYKFAVYDLT